MQEPVRLSSYADLKAALDRFTEEQLAMSITVSEGCDENGNADFFPGNLLLLAGDGTLLATSDGVLEKNQPVLLFNGPELEFVPTNPTLFDGPALSVQEYEEGLRLKAQFEMATSRHPSVVDQYVARDGVAGACTMLNNDFNLSLSLGPMLIQSDTEQGYWTNDFGWVSSPLAATGYPIGFAVPSMIASDAEMVPFSSAMEF